MDGEGTFLFLSNRRDRETNPELYSVKGSRATHYPRAPARYTIAGPLHNGTVKSHIIVVQTLPLRLHSLFSLSDGPGISGNSYSITITLRHAEYNQLITSIQAKLI